MATISFPSRAVPGLSTPSVGWEQPFEMLRACHSRVQRTLDLLLRLQDHVAHRGPDADVAQAATDVLRYFDVAAPLHHQDEEEQVFPLALTHGDAEVQDAVARLQREHSTMDAGWQALRLDLLQLAGSPPPSREWCATWSAGSQVPEFVGLYAHHLAIEEGLVYPRVEALLTPQSEEAMGRVMAHRRGAA